MYLNCPIVIDCADQISYNTNDMSVARAELSSVAEQFPNFDEGGNLVFCFNANREKLRSILSTGVKPRGGHERAGSFYPNSVSLTAIGAQGYTPPYYKYAVAVDPKWIKGNIQDFVGVGEQVCAKHFKEYLRVHALEDLPLSRIVADWLRAPMPAEVHYRGGVLPPDAFAGIVHGEEMQGFYKTRDFVAADELLREVVREVRQEGAVLPTLATYFRTGKMLDVI